MISNKTKSLLSKNLGELAQQIELLGGGINVKISSSDLIGILPSLPCSLVKEGIEPSTSERCIIFNQGAAKKK